jgi:hypothetical protein
MPQIIFDVTDILAALLRLAGMGVLGFGLAKFSLEMFRKGQQTWQFQSFLYVGLVLFLAAAIRFGAAAEVGGLALGLGLGLTLGLGQAKGEEKVE